MKINDFLKEMPPGQWKSMISFIIISSPFIITYSPWRRGPLSKKTDPLCPIVNKLDPLILGVQPSDSQASLVAQINSIYKEKCMLL